jgi:hypothetical protein
MEWSTIIRAILPSIIAFSPEAIFTLQIMLLNPSLLCNSYPAIKIIKIMLILVLLKDIMKH